MIGDNLTTSLLQKALDGTWQRQKAISANIANHETPGYKAQNVSFEEALAKEVAKVGREASFAANKTELLGKVKSAPITVGVDNSTSMRADGNNVSLDLENVEMVKTQIQYMYLTRSISDVYTGLKYAITGR